MNRVNVIGSNVNSGVMTAQILAVDTSDSGLKTPNITLYSSSFRVKLLTISLANASAIVRSADVDPVEVTVSSNVVTFSARSITTSNLNSLRTNTVVVAASVTSPGM